MIKIRIKKQIALLLAASMLMGFSLSTVDSIDVHAEATTPSVSAYATKTDLQSNLGSDSKIILGKKYGDTSGDLEWYVMGKDSGVSGENTAIFAVDNMIQREVCFNDDMENEKNYDSSMGAYTKNPEKVLPNHYGASDIRKLLRQISGEVGGVADEYKNLFSDAEKNLLNATTVRTDDFRGSSKTTFLDTPNYYTTSDKLYLPAYDYIGNRANGPKIDPKDFGYFYIGSESDRKSPSDAQWKDSEQGWFLLRSPFSNRYYISLNAWLDHGVYLGNVNINYYGVRPASNLNLTNVLFASAAEVPKVNTQESQAQGLSELGLLSGEDKKGIIEDGTAMTLRLDGSNKNIGAVKISDDEIQVTLSGANKDVSLVVQGKSFDGSEDKDWYYSYTYEKADLSDGAEIKMPSISKDTIKKELQEDLSIQDVDLSKCKVWLEITDDDGMIYAVSANEKTDNKTDDSDKGHSSGGGSSSSNTSTGWIKDSKGWKYRNSDGILAKGTTVTDADGNKVEKILWQKAGNGYYAFGSDGYLVTGWIYDKLEDKWYYCDENNGKLYGWFYSNTDGYWYYLSPSTGEAVTGWQSIDGKNYYFAGTPSVPTYSYDASTDTWIYSNPNGNHPFGSMYANTVTPDNYAVDASGAWVR